MSQIEFRGLLGLKNRLLWPNLRRLKLVLSLLQAFFTLLRLFFELLGGILALLSRKSAFASLHGAHPITFF